MLVNLETTGQHSVRFNPNLYNDGKVSEEVFGVLNQQCDSMQIEGSVTQRRNSILAILIKSGLCVTEHLGLKEFKSMFY